MCRRTEKIGRSVVQGPRWAVLRPEVGDLAGEEIQGALLHNDDFTTREFVVQVLVSVFHKGLAEATELMWQVHRKGVGVADIFPREIAETKVATVVALAREAEFPLRVSMEPES